MTKKVPKKILRIERHFFVNLRKKLFLAAHAAPRRRRRRFLWTGGAPPPPTEIDRRAAADTMTSAHRSTPHSCSCGGWVGQKGHHGLVCRTAQGRPLRHNATNDIMKIYNFVESENFQRR